MDPRGQNMARLAWKHLQFKPGADVSMLNAIIHTIIYEGLANEEFIKNRVDNYEAVKEKVKEFIINIQKLPQPKPILFSSIT